MLGYSAWAEVLIMFRETATTICINRFQRNSIRGDILGAVVPKANLSVWVDRSVFTTSTVAPVCAHVAFGSAKLRHVVKNKVIFTLDTPLMKVP